MARSRRLAIVIQTNISSHPPQKNEELLRKNEQTAVIEIVTFSSGHAFCSFSFDPAVSL